MVYHTSNIHLLFISIIYLKNFSRAKNNNLSKFVKIRVHNHRVQSYILAHPSKRSFEDFTVTLRSRKKKKKICPLEKTKILQIQFNFIDRAFARNKFPRMVGTSIPSLPVNHPPGSAYYSREDQKMRVWSVGSSTGNGLKKRLYGRKRREERREWRRKRGVGWPNPINRISIEPPPPPVSFFLSRSLRKQLTRLPGQTVRFEHFMKRPDISLAAALYRGPRFRRGWRRANKVSGAVLPWKRIGERRKEMVISRSI